MPAKVTWGSAHSACMISTCSSERRPRLQKFSKADELDRVPAEPDPEAPTAQRVERGGLLGNERGVALRQDQHLG
jgi:hypothetical protein